VNPRGRKPKKTNPEHKNKMVTLRLLGKNFNYLIDQAKQENTSLNQYLTNLILKQTTNREQS